MDAALIASALLLGLAGTPHCAAMCGAPCAAACAPGRPQQQLAFHVARLLGYAAAGAVAAASVGALAMLSQWSPALRPLWALLHALLLALGAWMLVTGRQPAWMGAIGRRATEAPQAAWATVSGPGPARQRGPRPWAALVAGGLWVAWPCGLLQSALLVASLTSHAAAGAVAMAAFALASSGGLLLAPWLWRQLQRQGHGVAIERALVRLAGALLVLAALFALGQGVWHQVAVYCGLA